MVYFISGHRDLTQEEFDANYVPALEDAIDNGQTTWEDCEFVVGDCKGCDEMAAKWIANYIKENSDYCDDCACSLTIHHMFSEPRFRIGTQGSDGHWYLDMRDIWSADLENEDDTISLEDMNLRFKEGQMVKMIGHDDMIVEGAIGVITDVQAETVKVLWGGMSAFKVDYKYRSGLKEISTTEVDPKNIEVTDKLSSWSTEPLRRYCIDDCVKYIGKDTEDLQYGDLLCVYAMNYSEHELQCIKLSDYNIYTISISDCVLHSTCYPLRKGTRVVVSMISHYTQKGKAGFILETDYRTCLPYCVKWDDGSTSWVIGCTVTTETQEDSIIEESEEDIKIDLISENGFSKEVTFYERN